MEDWAVENGRFDIRYNLTSLKCFLVALWDGHLSQLVKIFGYLQSVFVRRKCIGVSPEYIEENSGKSANVKSWL